jgi:hypothetical protein
MLTSASAAPAAATLPLFLPQAPPDKVSGLIHAATLLAQLLGQGRALDSRALRSAMEAAFGASDAEGAWVWKDAYEALEAAQVLFLRKFGGAMRARAGSSPAMLEMLTRLAARLASQTRRSEESERLQQFSTPIALGFVAATAAALTAADLFLNHPPARVCWRSSASSRKRGSSSTKFPKRAPGCSAACFATLRSRGTTPSRSTTASIPQSGPAWFS